MSKRRAKYQPSSPGSAQSETAPKLPLSLPPFDRTDRRTLDWLDNMDAFND